MGSQTYSSHGTFTWTCPVGVTSVTVQVWGAGAGGSGGKTTATATPAGGGGGGGFASGVVTVSPGSNYTVIVGAGGASLTSAGSGANGAGGGASSFNSTSVSASGGAAASSPFAGSSGGTGTNGSTLLTGGSGGSAGGGNNSGSGGSSAGTSSNGTSGSTGGGTTTGPTGSGSGGAAAPSGVGNGSAGGGPGGGGGGAGKSSGNTSGAGADGQVVITWADPPGTIRFEVVPAWRGVRQLLHPRARARAGGLVFHTGLTSRSAPGIAPEVVRVWRSPRALQHPRNRQPIWLNAALFHTGNVGPLPGRPPSVYSVHVAPVWRSPRALIHPRTRAPQRLGSAIFHTGLVGAPAVSGLRIHVAPVWRSPRALLHPRTRAPILWRPLFPVQDSAGLRRSKVIAVWRSPRALLHPRTRSPIRFKPATFPPQDMAGRHRVQLVARVRGPEPGAPIVARPHLVDWGRRHGAARGLFRVFNPATFRFYRSRSGPPAESDPPFATSAALPATTSASFADGTWYLSMSYFDGVLDSGFLPIGQDGQTYVELVVASGVGGSPPLAPLSASVQLRAGGIVRVTALYAETGASRGDTWALGYTTNGATPPTGSPTVTQAFTNTSTPQVLSYDLPAQSDGTVVKAVVQVRRGSTYSSPSPLLVAVADAVGPAQIQGGDVWRGSLPDEVT